MTDREMLQAILTGMQGMQSDIRGLQAEMKGVKEDIRGLQAEMKGVKEDIRGLQAEMKGVKEDIRVLQIDVQIVKKKVEDNFNELMIVEKIALQNQENIKKLNQKYDTLLLEQDNSKLALRMTERNSTDIEELRGRVESLELRMA